MSTPIVTALKDAGVKLPTATSRIWNWLKDNGPHTCSQVELALNLSQSGCSSLLSQMDSRGMVVVHDKVSNGSGRGINRYVAVGEIYEMKPLVSPTEKTRTPKTTLAIVPPLPVVKEPFSAEKHVASLTLPQAKEVYQYLYTFFN